MSGGIERIGWAVRVEHADGWRWHWDFWDEERAVMEAEAWAEDGYNAEAMPIYAAPEGTIESLEAERDELRHEVTTLNEMGADLTRERDELRATVERYREALEEIDSQRDNCVFSASREHKNGNETFMEGSNTAFLQCSDIARRALKPEEEA